MRYDRRMANINESNAPTETNEEDPTSFEAAYRPPSNMGELIREIDDVVQIGATPIYELTQEALEWFQTHPLRPVLERSLMEASERSKLLIDYLNSLEFTHQSEPRIVGFLSSLPRMPQPGDVVTISTRGTLFADPAEGLKSHPTIEELEDLPPIKPSLEDILREHTCGPYCVTYDKSGPEHPSESDDKDTDGEKSQPSMSIGYDSALAYLKTIVTESSGIDPAQKIRAAELLLMYGR